MMQSIESVDNCTYCNSRENHWDFLDAVYVICLADRPDRLKSTLDEIHSCGLCQANTNIYLAQRSQDGFVAGCWDSHVQVSKHALEKNQDVVLDLEDDFMFDKERPLNEIISQIKESIAQLPPEKWNRLSLGHISWFKMPYSKNLDRAASVLTHAQIWSKRGLQWMVDHPYDEASKMFNIQIDGFISLRLSHSYSVRPMIAFQRNMGSDRVKFADIMQPEGLKATEVWIPGLYAFGLILAACLFIFMAKFCLGCSWTGSLLPVAAIFVLPFALVWVLILLNAF